MGFGLWAFNRTHARGEALTASAIAAEETETSMAVARAPEAPAKLSENSGALGVPSSRSNANTTEWASSANSSDGLTGDHFIAMTSARVKSRQQSSASPTSTCVPAQRFAHSSV